MLRAGEKQTDDEVDELLREWTTVLGYTVNLVLGSKSEIFKYH